MWNEVYSVRLSLLLLLVFVLNCSSAFSDIRLTEEEVQEIRIEMRMSREELMKLKTESEETQNSYVQALNEMEQKYENELTALKDTYEEQNQYLNQQLKEARKNEAKAKMGAVLSGAGTLVIGISLVLVLL